MGDWRIEADRLRSEGLSIKKIATLVGRHKSTVGDYLTPSRCACGNKKGHGKARCQSCRSEAERLIHDVRVELVAGMYADGWTGREVSAALGRDPENHKGAGPELAEARRRGLIGYSAWTGPKGGGRRPSAVGLPDSRLKRG